MNPRFLFPLLALLGCVSLAPAQIKMRVSVKFILGPFGEMPAGGNGTFDEFVDIANQVDAANQILRATGRGYEFEIQEITTVSGPATAFFNSPREDKDDLEAAAEDDPPGFKWRDNAINMYVNNAQGSAICSLPSDEVILFGQKSRDTSLFHESGHYFNLKHTHEGEQFYGTDAQLCVVVDPVSPCSCASHVGGNDDAVDDTITDNECWTAADILANNPGATALEVANVFNNMMSYHDTRDRLTSDQLDIWADAANGPRNNVVNASTRFVDLNGIGVVQLGSSAFPFLNMTDGVNNANPGDIVLIRAGNYNEPIRITKPVTLRASRGVARLGVP